PVVGYNPPFQSHGRVDARVRLGSYEVLSLIGSGGMGEVYAAEDVNLKRRVALKVLPAIVAHDSEWRERFKREAQAVAALNHPNIVTVYTVELAGEIPFLTMEFVDGQPLSDLIPVAGFPVSRLLKITRALVDAVMAVHQRNILHRDLKPANV